MAVRSTLELDTSPYKKGMKEVEQVSEQTAKKQSGVWAKEGKKAGESAAQEIVKGLQEKLRARQAQLKEQFARGFISKEEFRKEGQKAAAEFNIGALKALDGLEKKGKITRTEFTKLAGSIKTTGVAAKKTGQQGTDGMNRWKRSTEGVRSSLLSVKALVVGVGAAIVARLGKALFDVGTEAEETRSKFETVFAGNLGEVDQFAESFGVKSGLVKREMQDLLATTGAITQGFGFTKEASAGFSKEIITLAADLASFNNLKGGTAEATDAIQSALAGEREKLKRLGIVIRQNDVDQRALMQTGKERTSQLTEAERATATLALITQKAGVAVGDLDRTFNSTANRTRRISASFKNMAQDLAESLLPAFGRLTELMEQSLPTVERWGRGFANLITTGIEMLDPVSGGSAREISSIRAQGMDDRTLSVRLAQEAVRRYQTTEKIAALSAKIAEGGAIVWDDQIGDVRDLNQELRDLQTEYETAGRVIRFLQREITTKGSPGGSTPSSGNKGVGSAAFPLPDSAPEAMRRMKEEVKALSAEFLLLVENGALPLSAAFEQVTAASNDVADAQARLDSANVQGRDATAETEALAAAKERLRAVVSNLAGALEEAGIPEDRFTAVMKDLVPILKAAGVEIEELDIEDQADGWAEWADTVEGGARMVLSVADAMGVLDENTRRALRGVIDIAAGISKIDFENLSSAASLGGIAMAAGGGIALVSSFVSALDQTEEQAKQIEEMRRLRQAMEDLREAVLSTISGEELSGVLGPAATLGKEITDYGDFGIKRYKPQGELKAAAKVMGVTVDEALRIFDKMEELTGLKIFDSKEGLLTDNFFAALEQLNQTDLGLFPETIQGQIEAMAFKWSLLGDAAGDATQKFDEFLKVIGEIGGGGPFADALKRALEDGGPEAANALIDSWTKRVAEGDQSLFQEGGVFFGLTGDEVRELLQSGNDLIEEWLNSNGGTSKSVQIGRSITEVQAVEVVAWLQDIAYGVRDLVAIQRAAAGMVSNTASVGAAMNSQPAALTQANSQVQAGSGGRPLIQTGDISVGTDEDTLFWALWKKLGEHTLQKSRERGV